MVKQNLLELLGWRKFSITILLAITIPTIKCFESSYYISVDGSDSWDGTSESNIEGTTVGPWKTLEHSITAIREVRGNPGFTVFLNFHPGTYFLEKTLNLDERDSYLVFQPLYPTFDSDSHVIISGGMKLSPTKYIDNHHKIKSVTFEGSCGEAFVGTHRLVPARSPNGAWREEEALTNIAVGPYNTIKGLLVETDTCKRDSDRNTACPDEDRNGFIIDNSLYSPDWEDLDQTKVLVFQSWVAEYAKLANITKHGDDWMILFQEPLSHAPVGAHPQSSGWRFLFYNNLALLDEPGEYVCVEKENGVSEFSYIPPNNKNELESGNDNAPIIVSQLGVMIHLHNAHHITMNYLTFRHSSSENSDGYNWGKRSTVQVYDSSDISFQSCEFSHVGMTGLFIRDSSQITLTRNMFYDIGYHALMVLYKGSPQMTDLTIENNIFNGYGMNSYWSPSCLWVGGYKNVIIRNNQVSNGPWSGILIKSHKPNNGDKQMEKFGKYDYAIEHNDVHDNGLGILSDFGAIKVNAGDANCNTRNETYLEEYCFTYAHVYNNRIRRVKAFHNGANDIYSDDGASKNTFENNLMYGEGGNAVYHHCGIENLSKNNFIHRTSIDYSESPDRYSSVWAGCEDNDRGHGYPQSYENERNIYLLDDVKDFAFARTFDRFYDSSPQFHHNLYWSLAPGDAKAEKLYPGQIDWYEWQEFGNDTDSIWKDPLFEDPLNHVYKLKENSPAWDLGIAQIDLENFGPQDKKIGPNCRSEN